MEELARLLFVLASVDRLTLLSEIKAEKLRLTQLAQKLSATVQETSKHLARLRDAKLIEKDSAGSYRLTTFGRLTLDHMLSFRFLAKNREYFLTHDISALPPEFIQRIGELSECERMGHITSFLSHIDQLIQEAEQYIWLMGDRPIAIQFEPAHPEKISFRGILKSNITPKDYQLAYSAPIPLELGLLNEVRLLIAMNEKTAAVTFPDLKGRIDFSRGFRGNKPGFHKWCHDIYTFYWDKSKKKL
jgi:predicted transcriptional regulator